MDRIVLTTEDVFIKNQQRIKILTSGIDTVEFNQNPIMPYEHNIEKILGTWTSIETLNNQITAIPMFDDDQFSLDIANKVKKNTIKCASVGLEINEAYLDGDVITISKSRLLEASIVSIPANPRARKVEYNNKNIMLFSNGKEINEEFMNKIKLNKMQEPLLIDAISTEQTKEITLSAQTDTELELVKTELEIAKAELEKTKIELEEAKVELEKEKICLEQVKSEQKPVEPVMSSDTKDIELSNKVKDLTELIDNKDKELESLKLELSLIKKEKIEKLIDNAIELGKITKESKLDFMDLSFEKVESLLGKIIPQNLSLSQTLTQKKSELNDYKTYDWYLKNDKNSLIKLCKENPSLYKQIETEYTNKQIK